MTVEDRCASWRQYLEQNGDGGEQSLEARFQVAECSLDEYEEDPSEANLKRQPRDVDDYLALVERAAPSRRPATTPPTTPSLESRVRELPFRR